MASATLSSKYQIVVPKAIRIELGLEVGQKFAVIANGQVIELVPLCSMPQAYGKTDAPRYRAGTITF